VQRPSLIAGLVLLLFLLTSSSQPARGQQRTSASKEADEALRQKAFDLLGSVAGQISILQSPENRARVAANVAESIWEHDEKLARAMIVSVQEDINLGLRNQTGEEASDRERRMVFTQLRVNTVERIAKHDAEMALAFFRGTEPPLPETTTGNDDSREWRMREEREFEIRLARQIADKNPEIALSLGRQSLAKELSYELIQLIRQLNRKHPEQAQTLLSEIVDKLRHVDLARDQSTFSFSATLARSLASSGINPESLRQLGKLFVDVGEANGCNQKFDDDDSRAYFCREIGQLLPLFAKVQVNAGRLKQWQPEESEDSPYSHWEELSEVAQTGSIDDILALATQHPEMRDSVYERAFTKALMIGDPDRARKIVAETPEGSEVRKSLLQMLEMQDKMVAKFQESMKDIDRALGEMKRTEEKLQFLLGAAVLSSRTDRKETIKLLNRASNLVEEMRPGSDQLEWQMILAVAYSVYNSPRGIVMMESLMPRLNELVSAAAKLDGYENHHLRDGEWNMSAEGPLGMLFTGLAQSAEYFAWCDFDRAVSVASQFERPELRLMAQVKLAQAILAGRPNLSKPIPFPMRWNY
jgi:hypothetical protein